MARKSGGEPEVLASLADDVLPTLVARLEHSRLGELEVRHDGWRIRLRRSPRHDDGLVPAVTASTRRMERRGDRPATDRPTDSTAESRPQSLRSVDHEPIEVPSPAVGYYLPLDGLAVGASLRSGDLIGYVDVLGVRHDVVVPRDGVLAAIDVESGQAVEYGEPLARLERARA